MAPPRGEVLQGTRDRIVLKTLEALGPLHGYGIAQRIQQVSEDLLMLRKQLLAARTALMARLLRGAEGA